MAVAGTLGVVALALFVVLEVQWIRYWSIGVREEKEKAP
jgi:hypothetical protein